MKKMAGHGSILKTSLHNFEEATKRLKVEDSVCEKIQNPLEKIELHLNPALSDSAITHIKAFIVRHNHALGPSKGGIRMSPGVTLDDVTGLAMEMTWKTSLIGVPFGGGKSGICCDPRDLSSKDKEVVIRSFVRNSIRYIGPEIYVPAPDMGTDEADMGHIRDCIAYSEGASITKGCFVTGKPAILGGILGRREATGKGVVYSILAACRCLGLDIKEMRVAVQGFGNVGSVAAGEIVRCGAKVIAVADISGAVINEQGINTEELSEYVARAKDVKGFAGAEQADREEVFNVDCDILIPAATGSQITAANADRISAKVIAEGANAPTTPEADEMINERGIFVIPDILCNAGGVFVSYLEYTQETQREQMTAEDVEGRLKNRINQCFEEVYSYSKEKGVSMRQAAMDLAVNKVVEATFARGFLP